MRGAGASGKRPEARNQPRPKAKTPAALTFTINPAAYTAPLRLSAISSEKMNQMLSWTTGNLKS